MTLLTRDGSMRTADRLIDAAKRNPEGVLLLAAGCALLMRGAGGSRPYRNEGQQWRGGAAASGAQRGVDSMRRDENEEGVVKAAQGYASDLAGRVRDSTEAVASYAADASRAAVDQSSRMASQTGATLRDAVDRMLNDQPLTVALFGLATGAVLAGALPASRMERRALAPVRESLSETAQEAGKRLKRSARKATERLGDIAEERGLTSEGLKEAASEVVEAATSELKSKSEGRQGAGGMGDRPKTVQPQGSPLTPGPASPERSDDARNRSTNTAQEGGPGQTGLPSTGEGRI